MKDKNRGRGMSFIDIARTQARMKAGGSRAVAAGMATAATVGVMIQDANSDADALAGHVIRLQQMQQSAGKNQQPPAKPAEEPTCVQVLSIFDHFTAPEDMREEVVGSTNEPLNVNPVNPKKLAAQLRDLAQKNPEVLLSVALPLAAPLAVTGYGPSALAAGYYNRKDGGLMQVLYHVLKYPGQVFWYPIPTLAGRLGFCIGRYGPMVAGLDKTIKEENKGRHPIVSVLELAALMTASEGPASVAEFGEMKRYMASVVKSSEIWSNFPALARFMLLSLFKNFGPNMGAANTYFRESDRGKSDSDYEKSSNSLFEAAAKGYRDGFVSTVPSALVAQKPLCDAASGMSWKGIFENAVKSVSTLRGFESLGLVTIGKAHAVGCLGLVAGSMLYGVNDKSSQVGNPNTPPPSFELSQASSSNNNNRFVRTAPFG